MSGSKYSLGLDFGTNSVRAVIVDVRDGRELASAVHNYARGVQGIILDSGDPDLARQHPLDYLEGIQKSVAQALEHAATDEAFSTKRVIGIGVDTTGSTPLPVDSSGNALVLGLGFEANA